MSAYKTKNLKSSFKNALSGIHFVFNTERNFRIHCTFSIIAIILSVLMRLSPIEYAVIVLCIALVLFAEMTNTAIELLIDFYIGNNYSFIGKNTKDLAAGSVLIVSLCSVMVGSVIFIPKIVKLFY